MGVWSWVTTTVALSLSRSENRGFLVEKPPGDVHVHSLCSSACSSDVVIACRLVVARPANNLNFQAQSFVRGASDSDACSPDRLALPMIWCERLHLSDLEISIGFKKILRAHPHAHIAAQMSLRSLNPCSWESSTMTVQLLEVLAR